MMEVAYQMLFWLLVGHALCDLPLQGPFLSQAKMRGGVTGFPWWIALLLHGLIHGGAVALVTGSVSLGIAETLLHAFIDHQKCEGRITLKVDQALHVCCKLVWLAIVAGGMRC